MDFSPLGTGRLWVGLGVLGLMALLAYFTLEPGRFRYLVWVLMAFFAFRILLDRWRVR